MSKYNCELCHDTGYYGDNGPGTMNNNEYVKCTCEPTKELEKSGIPLDLNIYEFQWSSGEYEWVSGRTIIEAIQTYCETTGSDVVEWEKDDEIVLLPRTKWADYTVVNVDYNPEHPEYSWEKMTFLQWLKRNPNPPSQMIAGTPYC